MIPGTDIHIYFAVILERKVEEKKKRRKLLAKAKQKA